MDQRGNHGERPSNPRGLARKLTCSIVSVVVGGICLLLLVMVALVLTSADGWGGGAKTRMIELEQENVLKLAAAKAGFVSEHFGRVRESVLQLRGFAQEALSEDQDEMVLNSHLASFSGLQQSETSFEHSSWFIPGFNETQVPADGSSLEGLLNRSSLLDVPFRAIQRQHPLVYLAALDDPSPAAGVVSQINMQSFPAFDTTSYLDFGLSNDCDARYDAGYESFAYEPRCRLWYQDAVQSGNTGVVFTNPYADADSEKLVLSAAAPVFDSDGNTIIGVVGLDMETEDIQSSFKNLTVIGDAGYAYLLAPGGEGQVAVHRNLNDYGSEQHILDLEEEFETSSEEEKEAFEALVARMSDGTECEGSAEYSMGGSTWILAWKHETVSGSSATGTDECGEGGFIAVVTIEESVLLEAFSETNSEIARLVVFGILVMAVVLLVIVGATFFIARIVAGGIVDPVNQLIGFVSALNRLDFSQEVGHWMVNSMCCPELEDLMKAFKAMTTIVRFANTTLAGGDIASSKLIYAEALALFESLRNERGVGIVNNNLGNVYMIQAMRLVVRSVVGMGNQTNQLTRQARQAFDIAEKHYRDAIEDAQNRCGIMLQQNGGGSSPLRRACSDGETKCGERLPSQMPRSQAQDVETGINAVSSDDGECRDLSSRENVYRQLANRMFNLANCLDAKHDSAVSTNEPVGPNAINEVRSLIERCIEMMPSHHPSHHLSSLTSRSRSRQITKDDLLLFGFLLKLSALERKQGRLREAGEALDRAEIILGQDFRFNTNGGPITVMEVDSAVETPVGIFHQRLLEARACLYVATGNSQHAIDNYTQAILRTGDKMDPDVVRSALVGLRGLVSPGGSTNGRNFSSELLVALSLPPGAGRENESLIAAIDNARTMVEATRATRRNATVDLCFVMDCTGSMQVWINKTRDKLRDIIKQTKAASPGISLRVAFAGYRDFKDRVQYEKFDFHSEEELPNFLEKLGNVQAYGGDDFPEDLAGGLKLATEMSWRSTTRLCILVADAPCHGTAYYVGRTDDRYPSGCPKGNDPSRLLYNLQEHIRADTYFIRITQFTDEMIRVFKKNISEIRKQESRGQSWAQRGVKERDIVVHNLKSRDNLVPNADVDDDRFLEAVVGSLTMSVEYM